MARRNANIERHYMIVTNSTNIPDDKRAEDRELTISLMAVLVKRSGGEVNISQSDMNNVAGGTLLARSEPDASLTIEYIERAGSVSV